MAILAAIGALALAAGCGSESHPNKPRPPLAAEVTVSITDNTISAQPGAVGVKSQNDANLTGNQGKQPNADPDAPLIVNFTIVNTTDTDTTLEIHGGGLRKSSGPLVARGNNVFKIALPTGRYRLEAADLPGATPAQFTVGKKRISSQNDLLLP